MDGLGIRDAGLLHGPFSKGDSKSSHYCHLPNFRYATREFTSFVPAFFQINADYR